MTETICDPDLMDEASRRAQQFLASLPQRPVAPSEADLAPLRAFLGRKMPDAPTPALAVLRTLDEIGSPATIASAGPRFFGFVNGGALPATLAAHWLASAWDQNGFSFASSPVAVLLEEIALDWVRDTLGLPEGVAAAFTTGATLANFSALSAARHRLLATSGWDVESEGLFGAPEIEVFVSQESHPTVRKGLGLLGLGRSRVHELATDSNGRIRVDEIPEFGPRTLVCAQAGNVNSGSFDPFPELVSACEKAGAWLHVDGAFGLWALASREKRCLATGIEGADSWATDGHKWLNVPYDCGIAFVRDGEALRSAMSISAAYLPADAPREPFHFTPEASRRARGVEIWAALLSLGRSGVESLVDRCCGHAKQFAEGLSEAGFEILNEVELNQVLVSFGDEAKNQRVVSAVQAEGVCWVGPTVWRERSAVRISVSGWSTTTEDVVQSLESIIRCAREED